MTTTRETSSDSTGTAGEGTAWSMGGRTFSFVAPLPAPLHIGAPVVLTSGGQQFLGQVIEKHTQAGDRLVSIGEQRTVAGEGTLIARLDGDRVSDVGADETFDNARVEPAPPTAVEAWLAGARQQSTLDLGTLRHPPGQPAALTAGGFNRHTFLCGQSGSGKTYTLGIVLEQLLVHTSLRIVVLDPNSDYVNLDQLTATASGESLADRICVFRSGQGSRQLRVRYGRLPLRQQAMVLDLDPLADADEYDLLRRLGADVGSTEYSLRQLRDRLTPETDDVSHKLARRIDNLGVLDWSIWAEPGQAPIADLLPEGWRAAVLDLGALAYPEERSVVAASILSALWRWREKREPVLVVIDEAHNVCPQHPADSSQALAIEHTERIAAEGRKYGLYLLMATQSPRKLNSNVLSQCENLLLMKTNSVADVAHLTEVFSHVPRGMVGQAVGFRMGEGLAAGRIVATPQFFKSGRRLSPEGGADIPTTWASG